MSFSQVNDLHGGYLRRRSLLDAQVIREDFTCLAFSGSHGAFDTLLGAGLLYYTMAQMVRAQVAVCIGSGGGFVPALLRRAQLDSGIEPAATYLVDANLPDLAFGSPVQSGGWMTRDNPFLTREADIVVLPMLSTDAARLFAAQGVSIDYLHIDGDHSKDGMIADFHAYAPLLTDRAVVTAHDLALPGVAQAVDHIMRQHPAWRMVGFPEVGAGTLLLRKQREAGLHNAIVGVDPGRNVVLRLREDEPAVADSQRRARYERWKYLSTEAYRLRYRLAVDMVDESDAAIVEIGGYPNSIVESARRARAIYLVEPFAPPEFVARLDAVSRETAVGLYWHKRSLSACTFDPSDLGPFNLLALGFDLSAGEDDAVELEAALVAFSRLALAARRTVVELAKYLPSEIIWRCLQDVLRPQVLFDITMDFQHDPVADSFFVKDDRAIRRLIVVRAGAPVDLCSPTVRSAFRAAAEASLAARGQQQAGPEPTEYELGTAILFHADGNSLPYRGRGWVAPEPRYSWSHGVESALLLVLDKDVLEENDEYVLELTLEPFTVPGKLMRQRFAIVVNRTEIFRMEMGPGRSLIKCRVPSNILRSNEILHILFAHPDAAQPASLVPGSVDKKHLAFRFFSMILRLGSAASGESARRTTASLERQT